MKKQNILITFSPIILLIGMLCFNLFFFNNTMQGPNQIALLIAAFVGAAIAYNQNISIKNLLKGIYESIKSSLNAIIILLIM